MNNELAKKIAVAIASGAIVAGGFMATGEKCDFVIKDDADEVCITAEQKAAVESGLRANSGFGGVRFNEK